MDRMIDMIIFVCLFASLSFGLATGSVLERLKYRIARHMGRFDEVALSFMFCPMCLGFWIGMAGSFVYDVSWVGLHPVFNHLLSAFAVSAFAQVLGSVTYTPSKD